MNAVDPGSIESWFLDYAARYYSGESDLDRHVRLKQNHTLRVRDNIASLCRNLACRAGDRRIAEAVALLHDLGRFEQYRCYRTFDDRVSTNHAFLGLRELAGAGVLHGCHVTERRLITRAIAYHNTIVLPKLEDARALFFMRLIRDADKLDVWRVLLENYRRNRDNTNNAIFCNIPDTPHVSQAVLNALQRSSLVHLRDVATLTDLKLLHISWVYDLNFAPAFRAVQRAGFIEQFLSILPSSPAIEGVVRTAVKYVALAARQPDGTQGNDPYPASAAFI